jgi:superfamily II DNA or RNA helicase
VLRGDGPDSAQACARTGSGKTVSFIAAHAKVGLFPIIVCVHTNRLKNQWLGSKSLKKGLRYLFGDKWVNDNVGIVQQGKCDYVGKLIVVAMMPSLARRKYPKEFYRYFATMGIDEVHKCSAPTLSRTLSLFNCSKIVGLTATPRLGSRAKVINTHLGKSRITSQQEVLKPIVYRIHYRRELKLYADNRTALITTVARLKDRNRLLARILYHKGHLRGRQCLGLSDRTDQLLDIKRRLMDMGVPERDIGLYVGAHKTGRYKPSCTITWQGRRVAQIRGAPSFETKLEAQSYIADWKDGVNFYHHKTGEIIPWPKDVEVKEEVKHEMHKISEGEYSRIENECPYVLATWGIFDTGIDISRLDFGMELTPRGDVEQGVGRVLRLHEGKPIPEWVTIQDEFYHYEEEEFFDHVERKIVHAQSPKRLAKQRLVSYRKQSATLKDVPDVEKALAA